MTFSIYGKTMQLPRDKAFYGSVAPDGSYPLYRYGGNYYPTVQPWTPTLKIVRDTIEGETGYDCNHVVVNRYLNGNDHIGLHRDKVKDFKPNAPVCTVSLGGTRTFVLKDDTTNEKEEIELTHGSLFILGAETNAKAKHSIRKTAKACEPRISLTYRAIATHADADGTIL